MSFPNLILGRGPCPRPTIELFRQRRLGLMGRFTVELIHARTGLIKRRLEFNNLITNAGLNALGGSLNIDATRTHCGVGTSSTAPDVTQTALSSATGTRVSGTWVGLGREAIPEYVYRRDEYTFLEANANGNLTEVGIFSAASGGTMFARQLFLDEFSSPTTIVKTSDDQLRVTYELRLYYPTNDVTEDDYNLSGVTTDITRRAFGVSGSARNWASGSVGDGFGFIRHFGGSANGWSAATATAQESDTLPAYTDTTISGTTNNASSTSLSTYTSGDFFRDITNIWNPATANFATGIGRIFVTAANAISTPQYCLRFAPKINKDNTKRVTLVTRFHWGRV